MSNSCPVKQRLLEGAFGYRCGRDGFLKVLRTKPWYKGFDMKTRMFLVSMCAVYVLLVSGCGLRPEANFTLEPETGLAPLEVNFTEDAYSRFLPITRYEWDFGDGTPRVHGKTVGHVYEKSGSYTVSLTVRNLLCRDTFKREGAALVTDGSAGLVVDFSASPVLGPGPLTVSFSNTSALGDIPALAFSWQFGDGGISHQENPQHTYRTPGMYTVILTIETDKGTFRRVKPGLVNVTASNEGEGESPVEGEVEGESPAEGEGESPVEGEGEVEAEGEGEPLQEGEGEVEGEEPGEGEGEPEGEGEVLEEGEGETEGEGELQEEGEGEILEGEGEIPGEGEPEGESEGEGEGEAEGEGETPEEGEGEIEGFFDCPEDTYFGQAATDVDAVPEFIPGVYVSDEDFYPDGAMPWDNFLVTGALNAAASVYVYVSGVHWWGVEGLGAGDSCPEPAGGFIIDIAETPNGVPAWSEEVMPEKVPANFDVQSEERVYPVYSYTVPAFSEPVQLVSGKEYWINIRRAGTDDDCHFGWLTTADGDNVFRLYTGGTAFEERSGNLAFCLTDTGAPADPRELVAVNMTRSASDDHLYVPGENVELTVRLETSGEGTLTTLDVIESLPTGWSFAGMTGAVRPDTVPVVGATGLITFKWNTVPSFPVEFRYLASPPVSDAVYLIAGHARYDVAGDILFSNESQTELRRFQTIFQVDRSANVAEYTAGETMDITFYYDRLGVQLPLAFGYVEQLPEGWFFEGIVDDGGAEPDIVPAVGTIGTLEIAWISAPSMPGYLTYRVWVPRNFRGLAFLAGYCVYRFGAEQLESALIESVFARAVPVPGKSLFEAGIRAREQFSMKLM